MVFISFAIFSIHKNCFHFIISILYNNHNHNHNHNHNNHNHNDDDGNENENETIAQKFYEQFYIFNSYVLY